MSVRLSPALLALAAACSEAGSGLPGGDAGLGVVDAGAVDAARLDIGLPGPTCDFLFQNESSFAPTQVTTAVGATQACPSPETDCWAATSRVVQDGCTSYIGYVEISKSGPASPQELGWEYNYLVRVCHDCEESRYLRLWSRSGELVSDRPVLDLDQVFVGPYLSTSLVDESGAELPEVCGPGERSGAPSASVVELQPGRVLGISYFNGRSSEPPWSDLVVSRYASPPPYAEGAPFDFRNITSLSFQLPRTYESADSALAEVSAPLSCRMAGLPPRPESLSGQALEWPRSDSLLITILDDPDLPERWLTDVENLQMQDD